MIGDNQRLLVQTARFAVAAWISARQRVESPSTKDLAEAFCGLLPVDRGFELTTVRNPSSMLYEARWRQFGRELEDFPKPFCAEEEGDARILACAALMELRPK